MFTDMVGYSALSQRDDQLALELLEEHRRLLREIFPRFHGTEVKTIGDAFLVEFNSALEAAQCAIAIQRALVKRNADVPPDRRIELKIGIHIGDVVHRDGDVFGDGVNIASRIEPVAGAGGICVSMDVERQIRNTLDARFEKLAPTELKNISVPMDLFRIVLPWELPARAEKFKRPDAGMAVSAAKEARPKSTIPKWAMIGAVVVAVAVISLLLWSKRTAPVSAVPEKSIAVLPFENLSEDKANAYFADGIQDEILTRLSKIADLKVISRTSTQHYKSAPENLPEIARQLGVAHILEGSVQKAGNAVRVNVQLIDAATDAHLWAETYDRNLVDVFSVESEISQAIAATLRATLTGTEKNAIAQRPTENSEAHDLYLKGRFFWSRRTSADFDKAISYFKQAIEKDPGYGAAYAALAETYVIIPAFGGGAPRDWIPKAKMAAQKALALDDKSAEAHTALAMALWLYDYDFEQSRIEFQRAIGLNPNYVTAHMWYGTWCAVSLGRFEEAVAEVQRALELDPLSLICNTDLGSVFIATRRYGLALEQLRKTVELDQNFYYVHQLLGEALELNGDWPEAITEYQTARQLTDDPIILGLLGHAYGMMGNTNEARQILSQLTELSTHRYVYAYALALIQLALDNKEEAIAWLEKGYNDRDSYIASIKTDPLLDPLRGDPRFEKIVQSLTSKK
jgi:TolB-like protein/class 3 adenylate cyclase/Flp pilus assembly protein TadD